MRRPASFVASVDIAARSLFFPAAEAYFPRIGLAIDHHPSFEGFGAAQCVDPSRAACGEIVYEICRELGEVTAEVALPLYAAVATDTGCFVYANTTANTHMVAAALLATGIDYFSVNKRHFRTKTRARIALEADILSHMEFFHEGRGVFLAVPIALMERVGATENDAEDLSALATVVEGATEVCRLLGGGGHAMAAGATLEGDLPSVKAQVLAAVDAVKQS